MAAMHAMLPMHAINSDMNLLLRFLDILPAIVSPPPPKKKQFKGNISFQA